jgi:hypothetical protein
MLGGFDSNRFFVEMPISAVGQARPATGSRLLRAACLLRAPHAGGASGC